MQPNKGGDKNGTNTSLTVGIKAINLIRDIKAVSKYKEAQKN